MAGDFAVGQRVRAADDLSKGTIRYVGPVDRSTGKWLGVEWDDPARGRHDGSIDGRRYFECRVDGSGSFIRPRRCLCASSLLEAVQDKYMDAAEQTERFLIGKNSESKGEFKIPVSFVGEDSVASRISQLETLACVSVRGMRVASIEPNCLGILQSLRELDLDDNLLTDWEDVFYILPNIVELRLGKNKLRPSIPRSLFEGTSRLPSRLQKLMLNSVDNAWHHVCDLAEHGYLSSLTELYLGDNHIEMLDSLPSSGLEQLTLLDLSGNCISEWNRIVCLSSLPSLSVLILDNNHLKTVNSDGSECFPKLTSLSLYGNRISSFDGFSELQAIPLLKSLRVQKNPVEGQMGFRLMRSLLIGLLPDLDVLNRSEVTIRERKNSEFEFLRFCQAPSSIWHRCPRHLQLLNKHETQPSENVENPGQSAMHSLSLRIRSNLAASMTMAPATKNVLQSMAIDLIVQLARRYFKIPQSEDLVLYYHDPDSGFPILLDDWSKPLEFYAVRSGGEIIVESKQKSCV